MNQQSILKCPFRNPLISKDYGCEFAHEATHRDGPGVICEKAEAHQRCVGFFNTLKNAALPVLGVADDLTQMPASVISRIQYGGLQGLANMADQGPDATENINALLEAVLMKFKAIDAIDYTMAAQVIQDYKLRKRRR